MTLRQDIQDHLADSDFDAVEDAWLVHLEEQPHDPEFFTEVATALDRAGEGERARTLLELYDDHLSAAGRWNDRLDLLRRAGDLLLDRVDLHPAILTTLGELYGDRPSFEAMVEKVGLRRATDDIPKSWKKADRLADLVAFDLGTIVHLEGKGAGRVVEVNMELESFNVHFEQHGDLRVGFGGAAKLLKPLPRGHILRRKLEEPEELERLRDEEPTGLLRTVLESYPQPRTGAEIRRDLIGIVPEEKWNSWWTTARKHPQILAAPGKRRAYTWAASSHDARAAVWQSFVKADPRTQLGLMRRSAERDSELASRMAGILAKAAERVVQEDPGLACEIWFGLEKVGLADREVPWSPAALVGTDSGINELLPRFVGIRDRALRERAYVIAREIREDWQDLYVQLLWQESEARALDRLTDGLLETAGDLFRGFFDQLLSQPRKNPGAFTWLAERAADRAEWLERSPLRLLKQILGSLTSESFVTYRSRLEPLCESGGTLPRLLDHLTPEQAAQAAEALEKAMGLVDYQRNPLLNALYLRFPELRREAEAPLYATPEAIAAKREELRHLVEVEIPANRRAIEEARELGDLSENFEYKSARDRHEYLSARATSLDRDLRRARPIDTPELDDQQVVIGCRVRCENPAGRTRTITILGPWDSAPQEDILSNESDLAQDLIGRKVGDNVELAGEHFAIVAIEPFR